MDKRRLIESAVAGDRVALAALLLEMERRGDWTLAATLCHRLEGPDHRHIVMDWCGRYALWLLNEWRRELRPERGCTRMDAFYAWRSVICQFGYIVTEGHVVDHRNDPSAPRAAWSLSREDPEDLRLLEEAFCRARSRSYRPMPEPIRTAIETVIKPWGEHTFDDLRAAASKSGRPALALRTLSQTLAPPDAPSVRAVWREVERTARVCIKPSDRRGFRGAVRVAPETHQQG